MQAICAAQLAKATGNEAGADECQVVLADADPNAPSSFAITRDGLRLYPELVHALDEIEGEGTLIAWDAIDGQVGPSVKAFLDAGGGNPLEGG